MSTETTCETDIALAGNPNVGKSTVFNALTGLKQHTGNWPGKTVSNARGNYDYDGRQYTLVDLPGTYSLLAHSAEEEIARDYILFGGAMATVVVCDATCLERNLNLALQICELSENVILCVNLLDEARKKGISIDLARLSQLLGVPVVGCAARSGEGLDELQQVIAKVCSGETKPQPTGVAYDKALLHAIAPLEHALEDMRLDIVLHSGGKSINPRWLALRLLQQDEGMPRLAKEHLGLDIIDTCAIQQAIDNLHDMDISSGELTDRVVSAIVYNGESIARQVMTGDGGTDIHAAATGVLPHRAACDVNSRDRKLDRLFTSKATGIPIMLALLAGILWLTIAGANYPSRLLSDALFSFQDVLTRFFVWLGTPEWVHGLLVLGMYRVLAWVISVMLPPMAIFFPLFTLLEDFGYLPRVAFNLDSLFKKAKACGKQALTMCMGNICCYMNCQNILAVWHFFLPSGV